MLTFIIAFYLGGATATAFLYYQPTYAKTAKASLVWPYTAYKLNRA